MARTTNCVILLGLLLVATKAGGAHAGDPRTFVWIEAEQYAECNFPHFEVSSMAKPKLLSGGQWIMKGISAEEVKQLVPDEGIRLKYNVNVPRQATYHLWAHVGWFGARADFEWRIGDRDWTRFPKTMPTTNLMELGFFCEASWAKLGEVRLDSSTTTLELRYPRVTGEKERMLVALDCFALVEGTFVPEGPLKPGQTYDDPLDRQAARQLFRLPGSEGVERVGVKLNGLWQVARYDDPNMDVDTYEPVRKLPSPDQYPLRWMGFEVPGSPWNSPPLVFGHRLVYRTRVEVPAEHRGRGFKLHFSGTNWIASVFVNGRLAGTHRGVWVPWDLDVSRFIEPGRVNEVAVAVKGT